MSVGMSTYGNNYTYRWPGHIWSMRFKDRLKTLGMTTREERCKTGDLVYMYKLTKGYESVHWETSEIKSDKASRKQDIISRIESEDLIIIIYLFIENKQR